MYRNYPSVIDSKYCASNILKNVPIKFFHSCCISISMVAKLNVCNIDLFHYHSSDKNDRNI